jgi:REP element-mobilizing transposase RayT
MTRARSDVVDLEVTPYYHCLARCVRRAFLCGDDAYSGRNFDHRKLWILERVKLLASLFAIDVCAYAVLANHFHLVLRVVAERIAAWSDDEVLDRVRRLCPTCVRGLGTMKAARRRKLVATWRERLGNLSWFMGRLDEYIARRANDEDGCKGRFWESRFGAKALMDDGALLACMAYVDLNPVRAGLATGLDDSSWTSIQQRLREAAAALAHAEAGPSNEAPPALEPPAAMSAEQPPAEPAGTEVTPAEHRIETPPAPELSRCPALAPMNDDARRGADRLKPSLLQYIELLEWTGRSMRADKPGSITAPPPELVAKLGLDPARWLESLEGFGALGGFVGHPSLLRSRASQLGRRWLRGQGRSGLAYASAA